MNTTVIMDETHNGTQEKPGGHLALVRERKGYSQEYVAGKLHLRVRIIELLEADDYEHMPEPVFIKGYLRAYAKLIGVPAEPLLEVFNNNYSPERKLEKALWQSKRESHTGERLVRILTGLIAIAAVAIAGIWWQKNKDNQQIFSAKTAPIMTELAVPKYDGELRLTDLSKMHSLFSPPNINGQITSLETTGG